MVFRLAVCLTGSTFSATDKPKKKRMRKLGKERCVRGRKRARPEREKCGLGRIELGS